MKIEFQYFDDCPNHDEAHAMLIDVLRHRDVGDPVDVVNAGDDPEFTERIKFGGSPTIRVDGTDIEPGFVDSGDYTLRCRVYPTREGLRGMPKREWIESAVDRALRA
jgi:hypothetical protein